MNFSEHVIPTGKSAFESDLSKNKLSTETFERIISLYTFLYMRCVILWSDGHATGVLLCILGNNALIMRAVEVG